jgi:hypothetical protein
MVTVPTDPEIPKLFELRLKVIEFADAVGAMAKAAAINKTDAASLRLVTLTKRSPYDEVLPQRLYAGLEAHEAGYGGDRKIGEFLGLDVHTVARGRRELLGGELERQRIRQAGGGRKSAEKKRRQRWTRLPVCCSTKPVAIPCGI